MSAIGSLLWLLLGGFFMGLGWWLAGLALAPIGQTIVTKEEAQAARSPAAGGRTIGLRSGR